MYMYIPASGNHHSTQLLRYVYIQWQVSSTWNFRHPLRNFRKILCGSGGNWYIPQRERYESSVGFLLPWDKRQNYFHCPSRTLESLESRPSTSLRFIFPNSLDVFSHDHSYRSLSPPVCCMLFSLPRTDFPNPFICLILVIILAS
jgi:hypothetical protein